MRYLKLAAAALSLVLMGSSAEADDYWYRDGDGPDIDVWTNKGYDANYYYGEDVAVYFRTEEDCYVVVYDIDPSGEVNILYPRSYDGSAFVSGGRVYRIPEYDDSFRLEVSGASGTEHIFAVASYDYMNPPDFMRYIGYDYGEDQYYDDSYFMVRFQGDLNDFVYRVGGRLASGPYTVAHSRFYVDTRYRPHSHYRYWGYDPYDIGSVWVGCDFPGAEIWIDGVFYGIAPVLVPQIVIGYHWVWVYYGGYPCYQRYFYVNHHQRFYIQARVDHRFKDFRYRRQAFGGWVFDQKKYRNEDGFKERAEQAREKNVRLRSVPPDLVRDYVKKGVVSSDAPIAKRVRAESPGEWNSGSGEKSRLIEKDDSPVTRGRETEPGKIEPRATEKDRSGSPAISEQDKGRETTEPRAIEKDKREQPKGSDRAVEPLAPEKPSKPESDKKEPTVKFPDRDRKVIQQETPNRPEPPARKEEPQYRQPVKEKGGATYERQDPPKKESARKESSGSKSSSQKAGKSAEKKGRAK